MIFSETMGKKTQFTSPVYVYKYHFLVIFKSKTRTFLIFDFLFTFENLLTFSFQFLGQ